MSRRPAEALVSGRGGMLVAGAAATAVLVSAVAVALSAVVQGPGSDSLVTQPRSEVRHASPPAGPALAAPAPDTTPTGRLTPEPASSSDTAATLPESPRRSSGPSAPKPRPSTSPVVPPRTAPAASAAAPSTPPVSSTLREDIHVGVMNSATTTVKWTLNRMDDLPPMAPREGKSITGPLQDDENRLVVRVVPNGLPECAVVQEFRTPPFDGQYYFGVTDGSGSCGGSPVLVLEMKTGRRIG